MSIIYSFLFCGLICVIGQIILDNTKLTAGHITSLLVVVGSVLELMAASLFKKRSKYILKIFE